MVKVCDCCSNSFCESFSAIGRLPSLGCPDTDDWHSVVGRMSQSHSGFERGDALRRANSERSRGTDYSRYQESIVKSQYQLKEEHAIFSSKIEELQKELEGECKRCQDLIAEREDQFSQVNGNLNDGIEKLKKQLRERLSCYDAEVAAYEKRILQDEESLDGELEKFREKCRQNEARIRSMFDKSQEKLRDETSRYEADDTKLREQFQKEKRIADVKIEELRKQLQPEDANLNGKVEELQKAFGQFQKQYEAEVADRKRIYVHTLNDQIEKLRVRSSTEQDILGGEINKLQEQYDKTVAEIDVYRSSQVKMPQKLSLEDNTNVTDEAEELQKEESTIASGEPVDQSPKDSANSSGGPEELDSPARDENVDLTIGVENHEGQPLEKNTIANDEVEGHSREDNIHGSDVTVEIEKAGQIVNAELDRGIEEPKQPSRGENADLHSKISEVENPCRGEIANIDDGAQELESQYLEKNRKVGGSIEQLLEPLEAEYQKSLSDLKEKNLKKQDDINDKIEVCQKRLGDINDKIEVCHKRLGEVIEKFSSEIEELELNMKRSFHKANAEHEEQFLREKTETESKILKIKKQQQEDDDVRHRIAVLQRQLQDKESALQKECKEQSIRFQEEKTRLECEITKFEKSLKVNVVEREKQFLKEMGVDDRIEELRNGLQDIRSRWRTSMELEEQFRKDLISLSVGVEDLQLPRYYRDKLSSAEEKIEDLEAEIKDLETQNAVLVKQNAVLNDRIKELERDLQGQRAAYRDKLAKRESQLQDEIRKLDEQLQDEMSHHEAELRRSESARVYDGRTVADLKKQNAELKQASQAEIEKLVKRLQSAELHNANASPGGESFLDSEATPHHLNRAVERVNTTSGNFTRLLMVALKEGGVDCSKVAKALTKSVRFERDAHTKFVYQALICKVLFADFESEYFNIEENAPTKLDSEQPRDENFRCYKELMLVENPEELVYEDATDNDFRSFCIKKQNDLIAALAASIGSSVPSNVGLLLFGKLFGRNGLRRSHPSSAGLLSQMKVASSFLKCALSVFLVHKLAFALQPTARIFRVRDFMEFNPDYMDKVVITSADSDSDDDAPPSKVSVGFMVVPGFFINQIVVHCQVYAVKR